MMKDLQIQETNARLRKLAIEMGIDPDSIEEKSLQEINEDLSRLNEDLIRMSAELDRQLKEVE